MGTVSHEQVALLTDYDTTSAYAVAYQNLFVSICLNWDQTSKKQQSLTIVAPAAYKGQGNAAANLAIAAAQNGIPTILVDADLHTPGLQPNFGLQKQVGLGELLSSEKISLQTLEQHLSKTFLTDLTLLGAGNVHYQPIEISRLFTSRLAQVRDILRQYLAEKETRAGLIIFNSPSTASGSDAALISSLVDQTFLVIVKGQTRRAQAQQAQEQIDRAHGQITGIIALNV